MNAILTRTLHPLTFTSPRKRRRMGEAARSAGRLALEMLESRTLMSGTWNTIDTFQLAPSGASAVKALAVDAQGNQYAAGYATDSAGVQHGIVRESLAGTGTWNPIFDTTSTNQFWGLTVDPHGDLFVCGGSTAGPGCVYERPAGSTKFSPVEQTSGGGQFYAVTSDAAGNVYVVGVNSVSTRKSTEEHWIVEKWTASTAKFQVIDDFTGGGVPTFNRSARGISIIPSGPAAGIYVVGLSANSGSGGLMHWTVRKGSLDGSAWSTVDDFQYDSASASFAYGVAGDSSGNVYVVGGSNTTIITGYKGKTPQYAGGPSHWIVRKSVSGNLGTWATMDDQAPPNTGSATANAVVVDASGVHVAGYTYDGTVNHSLVRTFSAGGWITDDDFTNGGSSALTVDAFGNLYTAGGLQLTAGGPLTWFVRTNANTTSAATIQLAPATTSPPITHTLDLITLSTSAVPPAPNSHASSTATYARALASDGPTADRQDALDSLLHSILD